METKAINVELKDADKGIVIARFATLGVKDRDGDIIMPGSVGAQRVVVSPYGHKVWQGALPVGKGSVGEEGDEAIANLQYFMDTQAGREHYTVLKELGDGQEWSFGFDVIEWAEPDDEQRQVGVRRIIKGLKIHEVSPVLIGAGIDTATLAVKDAKDEPAATPEPEPDIESEPGVVAEIVAAEEVAEKVEAADEVDDAEAKAERLDAEIKSAAADEYERFRRTLRRMGIAA
jgi:hypothetical protein